MRKAILEGFIIIVPNTYCKCYVLDDFEPVLDKRDADSILRIRDENVESEEIKGGERVYALLNISRIMRKRMQRVKKFKDDAYGYATLGTMIAPTLMIEKGMDVFKTVKEVRKLIADDSDEIDKLAINSLSKSIIEACRKVD